MGIRENRYQAGLIDRLERMFPGCVVLKNDSAYLQGVPDLLVLYEDKWAMLEAKRSGSAATQANQQYYVELFDRMSFAAFIDPSNEVDVLSELQIAFRTRR